MTRRHKNAYYHILRVNADADATTLRTAYRRLMRIYHPDRLTAQQRTDPAIQNLAYEIIEAYAILSDPTARAVYDGMQRAGQEGALRLANIRCSHTHAMFHAILRFDVADGDLFHVMEFGGIQPLAEQPKLMHIRYSLRRALRWVLPNSINVPTLFVAKSETLTLEQDLIDCGQINWGSKVCPCCSQTRMNANGTYTAWTVCRKCGMLACIGGVFQTSTGKAMICPWCAAFRPITFSVAVGTLANRAVRGTRPHGNAKPMLGGSLTLPDSWRDQS